MKAFALFLLIASVLWELGGTATTAWMYPAVQEQFWYNVPAWSGLFDYIAGLTAGLAVSVLVRREHHGGHYFGW